MKYKIGQWVEFKDEYAVETICPHCHHVEVTYDTMFRAGKITERELREVYTYSDLTVTDESFLEDGRAVHRPRVRQPKVNEPEMRPFYKIGEEWISESKIVGLKD